MASPESEPTASPPASPTADPFANPPSTIDHLIARCPTAEEIAAMDALLTLHFESDPSAGTLVCSAAKGSADLTLLQQRAYQALLAMRYLSFDAALPWTDQPLLDWLAGAIRGIRYRHDIEISYCCDPQGIINIQTQNLAALSTDRWIDAQSGTGLHGLVVLIVHEARHNQGFAHTCNTKDQTLAEMGAWGVQYWLQWWLAFHSDPDFLRPLAGDADFYRLSALSQALTVRATRFCAEPTLTPGPTPTLP
jgi:hypothetical protein